MSQTDAPPQPIQQLLAIMAQLRDPATGCPWDVDQTFATIAPYTIEEAYEVADAIERKDMAALKDELGDLLLQVVFHSRIAEEAKHFAFDDVVAAICAKMLRRHPHVFGDGGTPDCATRPDWEGLKAAERAATDDASALAGVALGLPALMRAAKLQKRAARVGFDWPDSDGPLDKIYEEIEEVKTANSENDRELELGDLLFAVVNWGRKQGIDPEIALRRANSKFERRFRSVETAAGPALAAMSIDDMEALWKIAKNATE